MGNSTYIEDCIEDILNDQDIISNDISIIFKRKYAYVVFYYSDSTSSSANKIEKQKLKDFLEFKKGSAHSVMRNTYFFELCQA